jgi:hypothetical protein
MLVELSAPLVERNVREVWNEIMPGIQEIHRSLPWTSWTIEDVYASCLEGESIVVCRDDTPPGKFFFTLRLVESSVGKILFMPLAWSPDTDIKQCPIFFPDLDIIARQNKCVGIEFVTAHEWLVNYLDQFGFDKKMYQVHKDVTQEGE